mgnify:CR=1 FL=1
MNSGYANTNGNVNSYKEQEILMSTPEQCVLHVYDIAIQSCKREEPQRAGKAVAALIDALSFEVEGDVAERLFRLYEYCLGLIYKMSFEQPVKILKELRETWHQALVNQEAA